MHLSTVPSIDSTTATNAYIHHAYVSYYGCRRQKLAGHGREGPRLWELQERERVLERHARGVRAGPQRGAPQPGAARRLLLPLLAAAACRALLLGTSQCLNIPRRRCGTVAALPSQATARASRSLPPRLSVGPGCQACPGKALPGIVRESSAAGEYLCGRGRSGRGRLGAAQLHVRAVGPAAQGHGRAGRGVRAEQAHRRCAATGQEVSWAKCANSIFSPARIYKQFF
jgi:hypothetical protein